MSILANLEKAKKIGPRKTETPTPETPKPETSKVDTRFDLNFVESSNKNKNFEAFNKVFSTAAYGIGMPASATENLSEKDKTEFLKTYGPKVIDKFNEYVRNSKYDLAKKYAEEAYLALQYVSPALAKKWKERTSGVFQRLKDTLPVVEENRKR